MSWRINKIADNIEKHLKTDVRVKKLGLQLDESTFRGNEAILLADVRFKDNSGPREEMLFAISLTQAKKVKQFLIKLFCISKKTIFYSKI